MKGPAFYAYASPEPAGLKTVQVRPEKAFYHGDKSEFFLMYDDVRKPTASIDENTASSSPCQGCGAFVVLGAQRIIIAPARAATAIPASPYEKDPVWACR